MKAKREPMRRVRFWCEPDLAAWIRQGAKREGKSISAFVRERFEIGVALIRNRQRHRRKKLRPPPVASRAGGFRVYRPARWAWRIGLDSPANIPKIKAETSAIDCNGWRRGCPHGQRILTAAGLGGPFGGGQGVPAHRERGERPPGPGQPEPLEPPAWLPRLR